MTREAIQHPCFDVGACKSVGRLHLPVAGRCNLRCNYCSDSARPRRTRRLLDVDNALALAARALRDDRIHVAGVSGPGESLFNRETFELLKGLKEEFGVTTCLCTNGLLLPHKIWKLRKIGVEYITITINAVDAEIAQKIYSHAIYRRRVVEGSKCAKILTRNQMKGLKLASGSMVVKVNSVLIPGVNEGHLVEVAEAIGGYAWIQNIIPLFPAGRFSELAPPSRELVESVRKECEKYVRQMRHCTFCRADAAGLLSESRTIFDV